jgi:hypothetical protein
MPNWSEGNLKVRGSKENIKKFLTEGIEPVSFFGVAGQQSEIEEDEYEFTVKSPARGFYVKGTRRHFIESTICFEYWEEQDEYVLIIENFKAAWGVYADQLAEISKEYNIDFKIYAFEKGMEFNQDIEIHKGEIIKDDEIQFNDYYWECINPTLGG